MKHIVKIKNSEPKSLIDYRQKTPNATYEGFQEKHDLREALLKQQGYICAYCMNRIENDRNLTKIDHYLSQKEYPKKQLEYGNFLACCDGGEGKDFEFQHCDTRKKNDELRVLNPYNVKCETLIKYRSNGEIFSDNKDADFDLNEILNLNTEFVLDRRRRSLEDVVQELIKRKSKGTWAKATLEKEIEKHKTKRNGKYRKYCQIIIFYLTKKLNKLQ